MTLMHLGGVGGGEERKRSKGKALHLKKRKNINKYKMETNWLAISIAGKDVELAVDQKLAAGLAVLKFRHRRGKLHTGGY